MITRAYEFEIIKDRGFYVALPYDLEGATQGEDWDDLCIMITDWLRINLEHFDMHGIEAPKPTYGNKPRYGGKNMLVLVSAGRETVPKMSAKEAAEKLGISPSRVSQLVNGNLLDGWREGRNVWVTIGSVEARLEEHPHAGRPRKSKSAGESKPEAHGLQSAQAARTAVG